MWDKILNPCFGKFDFVACKAWGRSLDEVEVGIAVICVLIAVFIIFRIWHWAVGDLELW